MRPYRYVSLIGLNVLCMPRASCTWLGNLLVLLAHSSSAIYSPPMTMRRPGCIALDVDPSICRSVLRGIGRGVIVGTGVIIVPCGINGSGSSHGI